MIKNDGSVDYKDFTKMTPEEQKNASVVFSEGSKHLENLLQTLWGCGCKTLACCAGHKEKQNPDEILDFDPDHISYANFPYISLNFNGNQYNLETVKYILTSLVLNKSVHSVNCTVGQTPEGEKFTKMNINVLDDLDFKDISDIFTNASECTKYCNDTSFLNEQEFINKNADMKKVLDVYDKFNDAQKEYIDACIDILMMPTYGSFCNFDWYTDRKGLHYNKGGIDWDKYLEDKRFMEQMNKNGGHWVELESSPEAKFSYDKTRNNIKTVSREK